MRRSPLLLFFLLALTASATRPRAPLQITSIAESLVSPKETWIGLQ
jgi:hypothetical protein